MVANPKELGAIPYNAAAMGFHDKSSRRPGRAHDRAELLGHHRQREP